jgi:hypothetical protein
MGDLCGLIWCAIAGLFRSRAALQFEILVLRHQLNVLRRKSPKRVAIGNIYRLVFCGLYRLSPKVLDALKIFRPETIPAIVGRIVDRRRAVGPRRLRALELSSWQDGNYQK